MINKNNETSTSNLSTSTSTLSSFDSHGTSSKESYNDNHNESNNQREESTIGASYRIMTSICERLRTVVTLLHWDMIHPPPLTSSFAQHSFSGKNVIYRTVSQKLHHWIQGDAITPNYHMLSTGGVPIDIEELLKVVNSMLEFAADIWGIRVALVAVVNREICDEM